jgi:hypothetical protein
MSKLKARKIAPRGGGLIEAVYDWRVGNKSGRSNFTLTWSTDPANAIRQDSRIPASRLICSWPAPSAKVAESLVTFAVSAGDGTLNKKTNDATKHAMGARGADWRSGDSLERSHPVAGRYDSVRDRSESAEPGTHNGSHHGVHHKNGTAVRCPFRRTWLRLFHWRQWVRLSARLYGPKADHPSSRRLCYTTSDP